MKRTNSNQTGATAILKIIFLPLLLVTIPACPSPDDHFEITRNTIDGGGGVSSGGPYVLSGTIGQPDAAYSTGGQYELLGGF